MTTYLDVHVLQTLPPSNVNRDEAGAPKTAVYGGARRARVSSQAWKRATRVAFAQEQSEDEKATRTKRIQSVLAAALTRRHGLDEEQAARIATAALSALGVKPNKKRAAETAYLLFFGLGQIELLVDALDDVPRLAGLDDAALTRAVADVPVLKILGEGHPMDVALFGRMVADLKHLNVHAAVQVAHALSTHAVETEFDYFTAVDDENAADESGAGMIGTIEFSSATLYRYADVDVDQLAKNLDDDPQALRRALTLFLSGFATSVPGGYQNSFAHRTAPHLLSLQVRTGQPVNLVSAFEAPVVARGLGLLAPSAVRLAQEQLRVDGPWCRPAEAVLTAYARPDDEQDAVLLARAFGEPLTLGAAVDAAVDAALRVRDTTGSPR